MTDDLLAQLDAPRAEAWRAEAAGDLIAGRVAGFGTNTTEYGTYNILILDVEVATVNGEKVDALQLAVHMMGTVLGGWFDKEQPKMGGRVAIRYEGKVASKTAGHNPYHNYRGVYEPPAGAPASDVDPAVAAVGAMFD